MRCSVEAEPLRLNLSRYTVHADDVCVTIVGANVGDVGRVPATLRGANLTENAANITALTNVDPRFLNYALLEANAQGQLKQFAGGAAQPKLALYKMEQVAVFCPPLRLQRRIADILSAYDDLIENNTKRIKILEEMARSLYREWFVNFRFPGHEKVKMVSSPTGKVPGGWSIVSLGDLADIQWGDTSTTKASYVAYGFTAYSASGPDGFLDHADIIHDGVVLSAIGAQCGKSWYARGSWSCIKNTIRFWGTDQR